MKASDINLAIKRKYSGDEWRVWFEVSQGTGAYSGRRADAVVMNLWPSKGHQLHVFEVKVSRADFKNEMANLTKWRAVGRFADFFWLACPCGLVSKDEVPSEWGLMELTKGGLRIKKQAPAREAEPISRGFAASLLRSGLDRSELEIQRLVSERVEAEREEIEDRANRRARYHLDQQEARLKRMETWKAEFEAAFGVGFNTHVAPERMAERIKLAEALDLRRFDGAARQARDFADMVESLH